MKRRDSTVPFFVETHPPSILTSAFPAYTLLFFHKAFSVFEHYRRRSTLIKQASLFLVSSAEPWKTCSSLNLLCTSRPQRPRPPPTKFHPAHFRLEAESPGFQASDEPGELLYASGNGATRPLRVAEDIRGSTPSARTNG